MTYIRHLFRPPSTDEEYVDSIRRSLLSERRNGVYCLFGSVGFLVLFFLTWFFFEWPAVDSLPGLYYHRAAGLLFGIVAGVLAGFCVFSVSEFGGQRRAWEFLFGLLVFSIALILYMRMPSVFACWFQQRDERTGFRNGVAVGGYLGFLLYGAIQNMIWAHQKLTGKRRAEQLMLKYYDELKTH